MSFDRKVLDLTLEMLNYKYDIMHASDPDEAEYLTLKRKACEIERELLLMMMLKREGYDI